MNISSTLMFLSLLVLTACSTVSSHVGDVKKNTEGDEYSLKETSDGFIVAGHYSEYQFIRNSKSGFTGCMQVINDAAREHAEVEKKKIKLPRWNEVEIIDHGRDLLTAIMNVNCKHEYKYISVAKNTDINTPVQPTSLLSRGSENHFSNDDIEVMEKMPKQSSSTKFLVARCKKCKATTAYYPSMAGSKVECSRCREIRTLPQ